MPYCTPPIVNNWSKKGELPNTRPERVERPITNRTGDELAAPPSWPSGAYQRPSRSSRWKFPEPPSGPPDCESPMECIVPPVGNGRSIRVSRIRETPKVDRMQLLHRSDARPVLEPVRSEEHTSELQSLAYLVCRLLLEKKKRDNNRHQLK